MKVRVKEAMCEGNGKCELAAPEVFRLGKDDDEVTLLLEEVPAELVDKVNRAIRVCPRLALEWAAG